MLTLVQQITVLEVVLPSGTSVSVTIFPFMLQAVVSASEDLEGLATGLLGNLNGNATDDLVDSSGKTIPTTSSEEDIYYKFGQTCEWNIIVSSLFVDSSKGMNVRLIKERVCSERNIKISRYILCVKRVDINKYGSISFVNCFLLLWKFECINSVFSAWLAERMEYSEHI